MTGYSFRATLPPRRRRGIALLSALYFLVVCALTATAVLFAERSQARNATATVNGAELIAAADDAVYSALATWDGFARLRQPVGTTMAASGQSSSPAVAKTVLITRLTTQLFSIVADVQSARDGAARRVGLLVRLPRLATGVRAALVSSTDVAIGPQVRVVIDSACGDTATAGILLAPTAQLSLDPTMAAGEQPRVVRDTVAGDSMTYQRIGNWWWSDLALGADIRLDDATHLSPAPVANDGVCTRGDSNWGDPNSLIAACATRAPIVYAAGDLTIDGGRGQGVLLVEGHLTIAGSFTFSGQIVARGGIETRADNISISGVVYASRARGDSIVTRAASSDVVLTHQTTLRYSGCDAWHGIASWIEPRRVRDRAWSELF